MMIWAGGRFVECSAEFKKSFSVIFFVVLFRFVDIAELEVLNIIERFLFGDVQNSEKNNEVNRQNSDFYFCRKFNPWAWTSK